MSNLKILQLNVRSLIPKKDIIEHYLEIHQIDVAILSETWLKSDSVIKFRNYEIISRNRNDGYGDVAILTRNDIKHLDQKPA